MDLSAVRQWLTTIVGQMFSGSQAVYTQVDSAIAQYKSISPEVSEHVGKSGIRQRLLCLRGTLPVNYRGTVFNIPVRIWFPRQFPNSSPMVYVDPTANMMVKQGKHVDEYGRIYHPYLAGWSDQSTVVQLCEVLIQVFSVEPPVYSRPQGQVPTTLPSNIGGGAYEHSPVSAAWSMASLTSMGYSTPMTSAAIYQPVTTRPATSIESDLASVTASMSISQGSSAQETAATAMKAHSTSDTSTPLSNQFVASTSDSSRTGGTSSTYTFNPVPGRPPVPNMSITSLPLGTSASHQNAHDAASMTSPLTLAQPTKSMSHGHAAAAAAAAVAEQDAHLNNSIASQPAGHGLLHSVAMDNARRQSFGTSGVNNSSIPTSSVSLSEAPPYAHISSSTAASPTQASFTSTQLSPRGSPHAEGGAAVHAIPPARVAATTIAQPQPPRESLIDSDPIDNQHNRLIGYKLEIFDRVFDAVKALSQKHAHVNKMLLDQSASLDSGSGVISEERRQLESSKRQLEANVKVLKEKLAQLQSEEAENVPELKAEDLPRVFKAENASMEQLFGLVGEINAIDDVLYYLGKALEDGNLSLSTYMRQVRKLAQQQFMAKALAIKIRKLHHLDD